MDVGTLMRVLASKLLRIIIVTALLLAATYAVLLFVPKQYESSASLLVEDRSSTFTQAATANLTPAAGQVSVDAVISSQIELIKSRDTLLAVIDSLNLRSVPEFNGAGSNPLNLVMALLGKKPEARNIDDIVVQNLDERLTVIRERDSTVITILARSADPQLAAKIANAVAAQHVKRRAQQSVSDTQDATAWLQQQIDQLRVKVQEADKKIADYKAQNGIFTGANGTTLPDQQMSDIGKQLTDAQGVLNTARRHADLIRSLLKSGQQVDGVDDVRNSVVVQQLLQNRATLQSSLAEKSATFLPAHPTIIALKAQIAQVDGQIKAEAKHIADGLDSQVSVETGIIASLNDDLKRAQLAASTQTQDSVTLDSLTREAKAQRDLLDAYLIKYRDAAGRTDTNAVLPDVRIISQAAPSALPASPKTALILAAAGFVSLALQIGIVLFGELMSGRAVYDHSARHLPAEPEFDTTVEDEVSHHADPASDEELETAVARAVEPPPRSRTAPPRHQSAFPSSLPLSDVAADIAMGRVRVVLLAAVADSRDAAIATDTLVREALRNGLSVCRVDAGSGRISAEPGLTDLCSDAASYGDVVHKVREGLAEVPWGQRKTLDRRSHRPLTLLEALADIYEVVVVATGRVGLNSSLPLFSGTAGRLLLVGRAETDATLLDAAAVDAESLGFDVVQAIAMPELESAAA
jgi:succinoglycan biosynthesis transport protein ExoP